MFTLKFYVYLCFKYLPNWGAQDWKAPSIDQQKLAGGKQSGFPLNPTKECTVCVWGRGEVNNFPQSSTWRVVGLRCLRSHLLPLQRKTKTGVLRRGSSRGHSASSRPRQRTSRADSSCPYQKGCGERRCRRPSFKCLRGNSSPPRSPNETIGAEKRQVSFSFILHTNPRRNVGILRPAYQLPVACYFISLRWVW